MCVFDFVLFFNRLFASRFVSFFTFKQLAKYMETTYNIGKSIDNFVSGNRYSNISINCSIFPNIFPQAR